MATSYSFNVSTDGVAYKLWRRKKMDHKEIERILDSLEDQFKDSVVSEQLTKVRDYIVELILDNATKAMELRDLHARCHQTKDKIREVMQTMTQTLEEIMKEDLT